VPWFKVQRAMLDTQFRRARMQLDGQQPGRAHIELARQRIAEEYEAFCQAVAHWTRLREQWIADTKRAMIRRWERSSLQMQLKELEYGLQLQYRRMRRLRAQLG
jgi:stearoyl-CoA desaturase (delta-9 desaturase)